MKIHKQLDSTSSLNCLSCSNEVDMSNFVFEEVKEEAKEEAKEEEKENNPGEEKVMTIEDASKEFACPLCMEIMR